MDLKPKQNLQQWYKRTKRRQHLQDSPEGYLSSRFFRHGIELDELTEEEKKELAAIDGRYRRTVTKIETYLTWYVYMIGLALLGVLVSVVSFIFNWGRPVFYFGLGSVWIAILVTQLFLGPSLRQKNKVKEDIEEDYLFTLEEGRER